jgi:endonuclease/exonuclease/phosphatase family metal-dependent hydrolase
MALDTRSALRGHVSLVTAVLAALLLAPPAFALRVVDYNLMYYPSVNVSGRNPYFRTVMSPLGADVVLAQEVQTQAGVDSFRTNVLNVLEPGQWLSAPFTDGNDHDNAMFYDSSKVQFLGQRAFYVSSDLTRYVNEYRLKPVGYSAAAAELRIYSVHLKSSTSDEAQRLREATGLRDTMNNVPPGTHCVITGDFNMYRSTETGFQKFLESQADNDGRVYDPLNAVGAWQDNASFASIHTQCPSTTAYRPTGQYAGGGLDDRFDMFLPTYNMKDSTGLELLAATYVPVGNDGQHLNKSVTDAPIAPEDTAYARALWWASDHLPVRVDIQLPAMISKASTLAFGTVIVGAPTQSQDLTISNPAVAPADSLNCTFAAPPGFGAPGPLAVAAGASAPATITMSTGTVGSPQGDLTINSDAPDSLVTYVALSGTVLDHAQVSLDSLAAVVRDTLDFGEETGGGFTPLLAAVHNLGWTAQDARLSVNAAQITSGDGRFSIQGFSPGTLVAGAAARWSVVFDDAGATFDSTYEATLVFQSADEELPGEQPQPNVEYVLRARVRQTHAVTPTLPTLTHLYQPVPNPLLSTSTLRFDLAQGASARLEIFDLSGRRVTVLADREFTPGRYSLRWNGRDDAGAPAGAGLYFVRLTGRGLSARTVRLAIVR